MPNNVEVEQWSQAQEYPIELDKDGKIIDFLDPEKKYENTPEEKVRQRMVQVMHHELGYPKDIIGTERPVQMGTDRSKRADIIIYTSPAAMAGNDQGQIILIGETKDPTHREPDGQLISYISATSAQGGFWTNDNAIYFYRKNTNTQQVESSLGIPRYSYSWESIGRFKKSDLIVPP